MLATKWSFSLVKWRIACFLEVEIGEVPFFLLHFSGPGGPGLAHFSRKIHLSALLVSHLFPKNVIKRREREWFPSSYYIFRAGPTRRHAMRTQFCTFHGNRHCAMSSADFLCQKRPLFWPPKRELEGANFHHRFHHNSSLRFPFFGARVGGAPCGRFFPSTRRASSTRIWVCEFQWGFKWGRRHRPEALK